MRSAGLENRAIKLKKNKLFCQKYFSVKNEKDNLKKSVNLKS
jgi:hypothetical protein